SDRLHGRIVIEQRAAAAVDLHIDKAGQEELILQIDASSLLHSRIALGDDVDDAIFLDEHRFIALETGVGEHASVDESGDHQIVSVTLRKFGGRSGSMPRASASSFTIR